MVCLFENVKGFEAVAPRLGLEYELGRFAAIPYAIPRVETMRELLREMVSRRIGVAFVTDASGVNPYDRLPGYWDEEVKAVAAMNAG